MNMKSLKFKVTALVSCFAAFMLVVVGGTFYVIRSQAEDGKIINIAGRQRMLSQKFTKELLDELNVRQVAASAEQFTKAVTRQIKADRAYYTKNIIGKLKREWSGFKAGTNYHSAKGSIPLPATFVREVSGTLDEKDGYKYDLVSKWNINKEKGLHNEFERQAWEAMSNNPNKPYGKFVQTGSGVQYRYASSDVASVAPCVSCHNNHPDSAKKDFKIGDLMGILVVSTSVTQDKGLSQALLNIDRDGAEGNYPFDKTGKLFDVSLDALMQGGTTFADLKMEKPIEIPGNTNSEINAKLTEVSALWSDLKSVSDKIQTEEVNSAPYVDALQRIRNLSLKVLKETNSAVGIYAENSNKKATSLMTMQAIALILTILLAAFSWYVADRILFRRLGDVVERIKDIAEGEGDLTQRLHAEKEDEIGEMAGWFNQFIAKIHDLVCNVMETAGVVVTSSQELTSCSTEISNGADNISQKVSQMATASHEMSVTSQEVAKNAETANNTSKDASSVALEGGEIVEKSIESMNGISGTAKETSQSIGTLGNRSNEIGEIVEVINDIADQTNLLALNAAIEAARAGEQGRGFAVVADEVRSLAERTSKATSQITEMIKGIQNDTSSALTAVENEMTAVEEGVGLAKDAGDALSGNVKFVQNVSDMMGQIATATEEQSKATSQISEDIEMVSEIASDTSGSAQKMAGLSVNLDRLASQLEQAFKSFKVSDIGTGSVSNANEIKWSDDWSTGVSWQDDQHKELVKGINNLFSAMSQGKGEDQVNSVLDFLGDYVVTHFGNEEKLMSELNYTDYDIHKKRHTDFINTFKEYRKKIKTQGISVELAVEIQKTLCDWLIAHICKIDKKLGTFLQQNMPKKTKENSVEIRQ